MRPLISTSMTCAGRQRGSCRADAQAPPAASHADRRGQVQTMGGSDFRRHRRHGRIVDSHIDQVLVLPAAVAQHQHVSWTTCRRAIAARRSAAARVGQERLDVGSFAGFLTISILRWSEDTAVAELSSSRTSKPAGYEFHSQAAASSPTRRGAAAIAQSARTT